MSLPGELQTMALPDVLQWIASGRKTGTLHVERRSVQKRIILREGSIFSSWSNDPRESLGQFLIRLRLVTEEQLFRALLAQEEKGRLLGSILVADGLLSEDDLRRALKAKAEETVYDLFLWPSGQFEFREGEFPENILITFESLVTPVILEGIRRVDEWQRIRGVFPSMDSTFKVRGYFWDETKFDCFDQTFEINECVNVLALAEGEIAGMLSWKKVGKALVIVLLNVYPDYQGQGIGRLLMKDAIEQARKQDCSVVKVATSNDDLPALAYYQKLGFRIAEIAIGHLAKHHETELPGFSSIPTRDEIRLERPVRS